MARLGRAEVFAPDEIIAIQQSQDTQVLLPLASSESVTLRSASPLSVQGQFSTSHDLPSPNSETLLIKWRAAQNWLCPLALALAFRHLDSARHYT